MSEQTIEERIAALVIEEIISTRPQVITAALSALEKLPEQSRYNFRNPNAISEAQKAQAHFLLGNQLCHQAYATPLHPERKVEDYAKAFYERIFIPKSVQSEDAVNHYAFISATGYLMMQKLPGFLKTPRA